MPVVADLSILPEQRLADNDIWLIQLILDNGRQVQEGERMNLLYLIPLGLVLVGACFLLAAALMVFRISRDVPDELLKRWAIMTWFVFFFLGGYLFYFVLLALRVPFPAALVTGVILFGGALFVFLVIHLSRYTIGKTRESEQRLEDANRVMALKNRELAEEVAARSKAENQAKERLQHLATLHAIDLVITSSLDLQHTMRMFLEQVLPQLGMDAGAILLLNPHIQTLEYGAGMGFRTPAIENTWERLGEGTAGVVAKDRQILIHPSYASCPSFKERGLVGEEGFVAYYAAPLISQGKVIGVLEMFRRTPFEPDQEWRDYFKALAVQAAIAIDNVTLFKKLQDSNAELILAYDMTIEGWAKALELRDKETEGHTQRVTEMTLKVARKLGLKEEDLVHVRRGALLHDIGKMAVPDTILMKDGPLTDEEREMMQRHPQYAFEMLSPIAYLHPSLDIPYGHHEWWDGSGYPRKLKGEQIPLAARIFALADTWDALVSERRYHPAWPAAKTAAHLRSLAGKQFDPAMVEIFLQNMGQP